MLDHLITNKGYGDTSSIRSVFCVLVEEGTKGNNYRQDQEEQTQALQQLSPPETLIRTSKNKTDQRGCKGHDKQNNPSIHCFLLIFETI